MTAEARAARLRRAAILLHKQLAIQFAVRADIQEVSDVALLFEYDSEISRDVNAPAAGVRFVDRVVIEKRMKWIF